MKEENKNIIPTNTNTETALDIAAFVGSAVPWIGGPVSNVLGGIFAGRKLARVNDVLKGLILDLKEFKSESSEKYVKTQDFEELLEQTLKNVIDEQDEEKITIYRAFLANAIENPGEPYDEQIRFIRTLREVQSDHLRILRALNQAPDLNPDTMGSPLQTLSKRLKGNEGIDIEELVSQLNDMRITNMSSLKTLMIGHGASNLSHSITPYGQRFMKFIMATTRYT